MLERQAEWRKSRKDLRWPEKIRIAERVPSTMIRLRVGKGEARRPR